MVAKQRVVKQAQQDPFRSASIRLKLIFQQTTLTFHCFAVQASKACAYSSYSRHHPTKQPGLLALHNTHTQSEAVHQSLTAEPDTCNLLAVMLH